MNSRDAVSKKDTLTSQDGVCAHGKGSEVAYTDLVDVEIVRSIIASCQSPEPFQPAAPITQLQ